MKLYQPSVVSEPEELRATVAKTRRAGRTIGLVPTMGALHAGHLSLVARSVADCDFTVVTIFVNPTQFGAGEDIARYPRTLERDVKLLAEQGVDVIFAPSTEAMYPPKNATRVVVDRLTREWEGRCRPGHFSGVATIVAKLLFLAEADVAYFGQKDYQQYLVIRQMAADLNIATRIQILPTVREPDGLAMSSRNAYLSEPERKQALAVVEALRSAASGIAAGERDPTVVVRAMRERLQSAGLGPIDYAALVDPVELEPVRDFSGNTLAVVATMCGTTRLIDNLLIDPAGRVIEPPTEGFTSP